MTGRMENEMKIFSETERLLDGMPDYVRGWYMNLRASRKTAATCRDYIRKVRRFLSSINPDVKKVKAEEINNEVVTKYYLTIQTKETPEGIVYTSDSYQNTIWFCLENFFQYLDHAGDIKENFIKNITKPTNNDLDRINEHRILLTADDFKTIVNSVNMESNMFLRKRDKAIILLFMNTGIRCTALSTILLDDIDFVMKHLSIIDKGNKRHEYVLNDVVMRAIDEWLNERGESQDKHLFLTRRGTPASAHVISDVVYKYTNVALGKHISPHKLRSGYCSILYNKTGDIEFVRRCVGHSNVATTQRYIVTKGSEKERSSEIMGELLG